MNISHLTRETAPDRRAAVPLPERVLQFGEGNFLRGFVDWMIDGMNRQGLFQGSIVVVQPIREGLVGKLNRQGGVYTLLMRGLEAGQAAQQTELITSVSRGIDPYTAFGEFLACARNPSLRFVVSNTTEAGISFSATDAITDQPPGSFPGKLTRFLWERFNACGGAADGGFILLPCELIDRNGDTLRAAVLQTARHWNLPERFVSWIETANTFATTLVDRIVTGYPRDEADKICAALGYRDDILVTSELFHFWAIEAPKEVASVFPLEQAGYNVAWTTDIKPYRDRKVRILNGGHTSMALAGFLAGKNTVGECMADPVISRFLERVIYEEVAPTLTLPAQEVAQFSAAVIERFRNPFIQHQLLSIALNSVSKYKARVLPTVEDYLRLHRAVPPCATFGLAALMAFYRGRRGEEEYRVMDDPPVLEWFAESWRGYDGSGSSISALVSETLGNEALWGRDLRTVHGLPDAVETHLSSILRKGVYTAMSQI